MDHLTLVTKQLAVDDEGTVEGIAWPYATPDAAGDIIKKGAVRKSVNELPMLRNHNTDELIGLWTEVTERNDGLYVKGRLNLKESMLARGVRSQILTGRLNGLSIAFPRSSVKSIQQGKNRIISELEIIEVSVLRNPSHPGARITASKNSGAHAIAEAIQRATAALASER